MLHGSSRTLGEFSMSMSANHSHAEQKPTNQIAGADRFAVLAMNGLAALIFLIAVTAIAVA
jgi:hypothetical protein